MVFSHFPITQQLHTFHLCATLNVPPQITHIWRHQLTVSISPSCPLTQFPLNLACSINPHNTTFQTSWKPILFQICLIPCLVLTGQDCCQYPLHMWLPWLTVTPSVSLGLHLDPNELHTAIQWWLGLCPYGATDVPTPLCALCPEKALDPLCHHSITCKRGSDVTNRHNRLRNTIFSACQRASAGCGLGSSELRTRPGDILVTSWRVKDTAAFDITVTSPLSPKIVSEAGVSAG